MKKIISHKIIHCTHIPHHSLVTMAGIKSGLVGCLAQGYYTLHKSGLWLLYNSHKTLRKFRELSHDAPISIRKYKGNRDVNMEIDKII